MLRRTMAALLVLACAGVVVVYQVTRPDRASSDPRVFVPSPEFFEDFSPSFRTSIADTYYLAMVQYYGEHIAGDGQLDSLPQMVDLVATLSPHFIRSYLFGAFALVDAGRPDVAEEMLEEGFEENPSEWLLPMLLGFFAYEYGEEEDKNLTAAQWYERAAAVPGSPDYVPRLAAALLAKGGEDEKAILMWGQAYVAGDKYTRQKAVKGIRSVLPKGRDATLRALAPLVDTMPEDELNALLADLFPEGEL